MYNLKNIITTAAISFLFCNAVFASDTLPHIRAFYRPDGGVSTMYFLSSGCQSDETEIQCMDRITAVSSYKDLPYDDISQDQLPPEGKDRDKWRGEKGKGIWIDNSLVTKSEKIQELEKKIDEESDKDSPNTSKVIKWQHWLEKTKSIDRSVLTKDDLAYYEEKPKSFIASAIETIGGVIGDVLSGIKDGFLALKSLIIGTPDQPGGVTIYDIKTKQPYCSVVLSGQSVNIPGACSPDLIANYLVSLGGAINPPPTNQQPTSTSTPADTQPPVITLKGKNPSKIELNSTYSDMGVTVTDNVNDNLGYQVAVDGVSMPQVIIDTSTVGQHLITYTATDQAGNTATTTRTVIVYDPDATKPKANPPANSSTNPPTASTTPTTTETTASSSTATSTQ